MDNDMKIQKRYHDETVWEEVSEEHARAMLERTYQDGNKAIAFLKDIGTLADDVAIYRVVEEE